MQKGKSVTELRIINHKDKDRFAEQLISCAEKILKERQCKSRTDSIDIVRH